MVFYRGAASYQCQEISLRQLSCWWLQPILPESDLVIEDVGINPTRAGVLYVLKAMGANLEILEEKWQGEPRADIRIRSSRLRGVEIGGSTIPSLIDELPVIAVAAAFAEGTTVIRDAAELRVKECDRIAVMARELTRLGVDISERSDGWRIKGGRKIHGGEAHGAGDHRIVMALAVLGLGGSNEVSIRGAEAVGISYQVLLRLYASWGPMWKRSNTELFILK